MGLLPLKKEETEDLTYCSPPCEDTMRKPTSASQDLSAPWSRISSRTVRDEFVVEATQSMAICYHSLN